MLAQFRHQHFLVFLIAHLQKAALLMFSDRLVEAPKHLDVRHASSVKRFKRAIRASFKGFLRFTHRYRFHAIADQAQARALFQMTAKHLATDALYAEVKERIADMNAYLDADSLRRQANTVVRLTVVTIIGLIDTITTGFLGMNLLAGGRRTALAARRAVSRPPQRHHPAVDLHPGQIQTAVGFSRRALRRALALAGQGPGVGGGLAARRGLSGASADANICKFNARSQHHVPSD